MARAALNWTVRELAEAADVHRNTISNIENGKFAGDGRTLRQIEDALRRGGVDFVGDDGVGVGVRLRNQSGE